MVGSQVGTISWVNGHPSLSKMLNHEGSNKEPVGTSKARISLLFHVPTVTQFNFALNFGYWRVELLKSSGPCG